MSFFDPSLLFLTKRDHHSDLVVLLNFFLNCFNRIHISSQISTQSFQINPLIRSRVFIKTDHLILRCDYCDVPVFGNNQKSQQGLVSLPDGCQEKLVLLQELIYNKERGLQYTAAAIMALAGQEVTRKLEV